MNGPTLIPLWHESDVVNLLSLCRCGSQSTVYSVEVKKSDSAPSNARLSRNTEFFFFVLFFFSEHTRLHITRHNSVNILLSYVLNATSQTKTNYVCGTGTTQTKTAVICKDSDRQIATQKANEEERKEIGKSIFEHSNSNARNLGHVGKIGCARHATAAAHNRIRLWANESSKQYLTVRWSIQFAPHLLLQRLHEEVCRGIALVNHQTSLNAAHIPAASFIALLKQRRRSKHVYKIIFEFLNKPHGSTLLAQEVQEVWGKRQNWRSQSDVISKSFATHLHLRNGTRRTEKALYVNEIHFTKLKMIFASRRSRGV